MTDEQVIPYRMWAVLFTRPGLFEIRPDIPVPRPGAGQVLVRMLRAGFGALDRRILAGEVAGVRFPHIPGRELAGEVASVGAGVDEVGPGDRVAVEAQAGCARCPRCLEGLPRLCEHAGRPDKGHVHLGVTVAGGLAEYAAVPARALHRVPAPVSPDQAVFADCLGVALASLERGRLRPGERVAVIGDGALAILAAQAARAMGAGRVALAGRPEWLEPLRALRLDALVAAPGPAAAGRLREVLGGCGADLVLACGDAPDLALLVARRGGRVVLASAPEAGGEPTGPDVAALVGDHLEVLGGAGGGAGATGRALELLARGAVDVAPLAAQHVPLSRFGEAWQAYRERRDGAPRVLLRP